MQAEAVTEKHVFGDPEILRELRVLSICWAVYFSLTMIYCIAYEQYVHGTTPQLLVDVLWFLDEWGLWMVLSPFLYAFLRRTQSGAGLSINDFLYAAACSFLLVLFTRMALDVATGAVHGPLQSLILHGPRYLLASIGIILVWVIFLSRRPVFAQSLAAENSTENEPEISTLLVYKGNNKSLLDINEINYASAAKNYVELHTPDNTYLIRSTIKQLEELLPSNQFIRTHRSNIVNIASIDRINTLPSGSGKVILQNGTDVPISKRYLSDLQAFSPANLGELNAQRRSQTSTTDANPAG